MTRFQFRPLRSRLLFGALLLPLALAACGGTPPAVDSTNYPMDRREKEKLDAEKRGESGSIFGKDGLVLFGKKKEEVAPGGVAVNSFLWRASLDTLSFLPLASADPFGGVIISEWYVAPASPNERLKVTVYIMDRTLRADGLKVVVFRQVRQGNTWAEAQPSPDTAHKLEDSILTRARELRLASVSAN